MFKPIEFAKIGLSHFSNRYKPAKPNSDIVLYNNAQPILSGLLFICNCVATTSPLQYPDKQDYYRYKRLIAEDVQKA